MLTSDVNTGASGARILFLSYDGLTDQLGRSQVLPYLIRLSQRGHQITIVSCEKADRMARDGELVRQLCSSSGLGWHPIAYHKRPPIVSSAFDTLALQAAAIKLHRKLRFDIVHCRSYIPARAGLLLKRWFGVRFLFDMRGFWPDEKAEGNNWNLKSPLYAQVYGYFKRLESRLLREADHIVSLTVAGKDQLLTRPELANDPPSITVIPCCVDFTHFRSATAERYRKGRDILGIGHNEAVLTYLGSLGASYMLREMLDFFKVYAARHRKARFLLVTAEDPLPIRQAAVERQIDPATILILPATREEVPRLLAAADLGIFFINQKFSKTASSPTKMGEMLAVGLPIVANWGVGDVGPIIEDIGAGIAIRDFTDDAYNSAIRELNMLKVGRDVRRKRAMPWFDVDLGADRYDEIYRDLIAR